MESNPLAKLTEGIQSSVSNNAPVDTPFTPRLQILHGTSQVMKNWKSEDGAKPGEGDFWLGPPGGTNLGKSIYVVPLATRDHALRYSGKSVEKESFNRPRPDNFPSGPEEEAFAEIERSPKQQGKGTFNNWGKDVFFWIPPQEKMPSGTFAIYFFHSTARSAVNRVVDHDKKVDNRGKLFELRSIMIPSANYTWPAPEFNIPTFDKLDPRWTEVPEKEKVIQELTKFLNPVAQNAVNSNGVDGRPR